MKVWSSCTRGVSVSFASHRSDAEGSDLHRRILQDDKYGNGVLARPFTLTVPISSKADIDAAYSSETSRLDAPGIEMDGTRVVVVVGRQEEGSVR